MKQSLCITDAVCVTDIRSFRSVSYSIANTNDHRDALANIEKHWMIKRYFGSILTAILASAVLIEFQVSNLRSKIMINLIPG